MISCLTSISVCFMCLCYPYVVYSISGRIGTGRSEIFLQRSNDFNFNIDLFPIFQALYRTKQCDTRKLTYFEYRSSCGCHNHLQVVREMDMAFLNTVCYITIHQPPAMWKQQEEQAHKHCLYVNELFLYSTRTCTRCTCRVLPEQFIRWSNINKKLPGGGEDQISHSS